MPGLIEGKKKVISRLLKLVELEKLRWREVRLKERKKDRLLRLLEMEKLRVTNGS